MKITLSPSEDQSAESVPYYTVSIETESDDVPVGRLVEMLYQVVTAWGYNRDMTQKAFNDFIQ